MRPESLALLKRISRTLWMVAVLTFVSLYVSRNWGRITELTPKIGVGSAVAIVIVTVAGKMVVSEQLRLSANLLGADLTPRRSYWIYCSSDLAKYVPGGVWNAMARVKLLRDEGISAGASGRAFAVDKLWQILGALFTGLLFARSSAHEVVLSAFVEDSVPVAVLEYAAISIGWVTAIVLVNRFLTGSLPSPYVLRRVITDQTLIAALLGLGVWIPLEAMGSASAPAAIGAFAIGRAFGYAAVFAPAGVGVREAVSLAVLAGSAESQVIVIALAVNRVLTVLADLLSYGLAVAFARRATSPQEGIASHE